MVQQQSVSVETLKAIADAFNAHDLDAIMEFFADDCSFDMPRGREPWGQRFTGKAVRDGLATRFKGLPDVHYGDDRHWVSPYAMLGRLEHRPPDVRGKFDNRKEARRVKIVFAGFINDAD